MSTAAPLSAAAVIQLLGLEAHPEGGFYRETFRDPSGDAHGRAHSTAIYFLLTAGVLSRWHRVDAAEVWHWYAGAALELSLRSGDGEPSTHLIGPALADGQRPQFVVPAGQWQQAKSLGAWTLVGCTVAPGFQFETFEITNGSL